MGSGHELREASRPPGGAAESGRLRDQARDLAEDFPGFEIGIQPSWRGVSLVAVRRDDGHPGVRVVVTTDPAEMRAVLARAAGAARVPDARVPDTRIPGGHSWTASTFPRSIPDPGMEALACPTAQTCYAAGSDAIPPDACVAIGISDQGSTSTPIYTNHG